MAAPVPVNYSAEFDNLAQDVLGQFDSKDEATGGPPKPLGDNDEKPAGDAGPAYMLFDLRRGQ